MTNRTISIASLAELPRPGVVTHTLPDLHIALFHLADGRLFAIEDRCPHRGARLSSGLVYEQDKVVCLDHGWCIRLTDGGVEPPERGAVRTFPVFVKDGDVYVELPEN